MEENWIVIYQVDSAIYPLNNCLGLEFLVIVHKYNYALCCKKNPWFGISVAVHIPTQKIIREYPPSYIGIYESVCDAWETDL